MNFFPKKIKKCQFVKKNSLYTAMLVMNGSGIERNRLWIIVLPKWREIQSRFQIPVQRDSSSVKTIADPGTAGFIAVRVKGEEK